jgi:small subunit ribosomal protein S9
MADEERNDEQQAPEDQDQPAGASDEVADEAAEPAAPLAPEPDDTGGEAQDVGADEPAEEAPAEETPAEEPAAEEMPAEEESPAADASGEAEPAGASDEVAGDQAEPAAPVAPEPDGAAAEGEDAGGDIEKPKAKDLPPGAELDPISLEPDRPVDAETRARMEAEAEERARLEAEATADGGEEPALSGPRVEVPADALIQATGKRKNAIARVVVRAGSGEFQVNQRPLDQYFPRAHLQTVARQALVTSGYEGNVDVAVRVQGGGVSGQADAIRHGIARALCEIDGDLRGELKRRGLLTRDARIKERRKAGLKKARKRPQFSKR